MRRVLLPAGTYRWAASVVIVLALHGSALLLLRRAVPDSDQAAPDAVLMELAPAPGAPPSLPDAVPAEPSPTPVPLQAEPPPPIPPPPVPEALAEPPPPEPVLPTPPEPETVAAAAPLPVVQQAVAPLEPPRPKRPPPRPTAAPPRVAAPPAAPAAAAQAAAVAPAATPAAAPPAPAAPAPAAAPPPGRAAVTWQEQLLAHLARYKRFPEEARRRGEQGVVMMRFSLDRAGHVLSAALVRGSGSASLDAEAEAWIRRADPMPSLPTEMPGATVELVVPMRFNLR